MTMTRLERWLWVIVASAIIAVGLIVAQIAEYEKRMGRWWLCRIILKIIIGGRMIAPRRTSLGVSGCQLGSKRL